jgi:hypothetical protein
MYDCHPSAGSSRDWPPPSLSHRVALGLAAMLPFLLVASTMTLTTAATATRDNVLFAFTDGDYDGWQQWNWTAITHLGFWTPPGDDVRAKAAAYGVRLMEDGHLPDAKDWLDADKRKAFVDSAVERVTSHKLGGVFFDYEGQLYGGVRDAYSKLARETAAALAPLNATIVICVGASPTYELRHYDYSALADASEFLFIMGYDMHFWDDYTCVTKGTCSPAEAPMRSLEKGVADYLKIVPGEKLTLGLPWYGQRYKYILGVPFNYGQIDYKDVLKVRLRIALFRDSSRHLCV